MALMVTFNPGVRSWGTNSQWQLLLSSAMSSPGRLASETTTTSQCWRRWSATPTWTMWHCSTSVKTHKLTNLSWRILWEELIKMKSSISQVQSIITLDCSIHSKHLCPLFHVGIWTIVQLWNPIQFIYISAILSKVIILMALTVLKHSWHFNICFFKLQ